MRTANFSGSDSTSLTGQYKNFCPRVIIAWCYYPVLFLATPRQRRVWKETLYLEMDGFKIDCYYHNKVVFRKVILHVGSWRKTTRYTSNTPNTLELCECPTWLCLIDLLQFPKPILFRVFQAKLAFILTDGLHAVPTRKVVTFRN